MEQLAATKDTKIKLKCITKQQLQQHNWASAEYLEHNDNVKYAISFYFQEMGKCY